MAAGSHGAARGCATHLRNRRSGVFDTLGRFFALAVLNAALAHPATFEALAVGLCGASRVSRGVGNRPRAGVEAHDTCLVALAVQGPKCTCQLVEVLWFQRKGFAGQRSGKSVSWWSTTVASLGE